MKLLNVPHFQQSGSHTCVPACVRMVLAYWGHAYTEEELVSVFRTVPRLGTLFDDIAPGLQRLGFRSLLFENADMKRLRNLINNNWPVIVFLDATDLRPGHRGFHALVIGASDNQIFCLDPEQNTLTTFKANVFERIWAKMHNQGLAIWE